MATHAPMARVPFAPLDNSRLQHLSSAKNRQNGLASHSVALNGKADISISKPLQSPTKRPFEPATFDDFDSENVDPAMFCSPSKKSKSNASEKPFKPFTFSLSATNSMPPPPSIPSRPTTPATANMSSLRAPLTAPAGRSPKRKTVGIHKSRRVSAPFSRIDPPSRSDSSLPFSLDAALSGTFAKSAPKNVGATIQESMPKKWFFDIYEDTPEEEAANLMEHSTLTLDLSSDEESRKSSKDYKGKENMPPDDYDAPTASRSAAEPAVAAPKRVKKNELIRRKVESDKMDDGERSPLSDLETHDFIPEGLDKDSHIVIHPTPEKSTATSSKLDVNNLFATPVPFAAGSKKATSAGTSSTTILDLPVVNTEGDVKGDIIVWEDSPSSLSSMSSLTEAQIDETKSKGFIASENKQPDVDEAL